MKLTDSPFIVFAVSFCSLVLSVWVGTNVLGKLWRPKDIVREDFGVIQAATLTLLGLIIAFSFSMAISRYDQRKMLEEAEANAIGTEYIRADLLSAEDAAKVRTLLREYFAERVRFYTANDAQQLRQIDVRTAQLQAKLWAAVVASAATTPTPTVALAVAGMNDVLNSQGYTQAAWWNRIPSAAWLMMLAIAVCAHVLVGYGARDAKAERIILLVLPLIMSIAFFLIADIDSPRGGVIRVLPDNLMSIAESLKANPP